MRIFTGSRLARSAKHVADFENVQQRRDVFDRARRADLDGEPPARLARLCRRQRACRAYATWRDHGAREPPVRPWLCRPASNARLMSSPNALASAGIRSRPIHCPDRIKRDPRDAPDTLMVGGTIEQERFERHEEHAGRIADTRHPLRLGADRAAQFLQHELVAGVSSPRNSPRSSSCTSIDRASGFRVRRYSRSRSTDCPSLVIGTASLQRTSPLTF